MDYAVQIVRAGSADSAQLIVAFVAVKDTYGAFVLDALPEHLGIYLRTSRRGAPVVDLDQDTNGDSSFVLRNDAVDILSTEGTGKTCIYRPSRWRCITSGD